MKKERTSITRRSNPRSRGSSGFERGKYLSGLLVILLITGIIFQPTPSPALLGGIGKAFSGVVGGAGRLLGAPFGGFVDGLTAPTVRNAENTGKRLISTMDTKMKSRIDQLDGSVAERLRQLDSSMEARILQLDETIAGSIAQTDQMLEARIQQVDDTLQDALTETDLILQERLEQLDEIAAKRIGNLDIVATKATFSLEEALLRLVGFSCLMIFLACAVWRIYSEGIRHWNRAEHPESSLLNQARLVLPTIARPVAGQLSLAAVSLLLLYGLFAFAPGGARARAEELASIHEDAFESSLRSMDLRRAGYHADQLRLLRPLSRHYRGMALKAELVRDLFNRPALLKNVGGINETLLRLEEIERLSVSKDPDLYALKGFVIWQATPTKVDELKVALLCRRALELGKSNGFALRSMAENYLKAYLSSPLPEIRIKELRNLQQLQDQRLASFTEDELTIVSNEELRAVLSQEPNASGDTWIRDRGFALIQDAMELNASMAELNARSSRAYLAMIRASAEIARIGEDAKPEERFKLLEDRASQARQVLDAWTDFDARVVDNPFLNSTSAPLASFYLNDAMWVRAQYYSKNPQADYIAPAILEIPVDQRQPYAPPRVKMATRLLGQLSPEVRAVIEFQEHERFVENERKLIQLEKAVREFDKAVSERTVGAAPLVQMGLNAALLAADLGLNEYPEGDSTTYASGSLADSLIEVLREKTRGTPDELLGRLAELEEELFEKIDRRKLKFL